MILGVEIAMVVVGLLALVRGRMTISKTKVVEGLPARLLGLLALTPLPVVLVVGIVFVVASNPADPEKFAADNKLTLTLIEAGIVIVIAILVFGIGAAIGKNPEEARRKSRRLRDEEEYADEGDDRYEEERYEDDRPRRRKRRDEEYDEDDDRDRRYR